jgi:hypothetical protein
MGEIHIFHDADARPQEWRVEEIDSDGDGGIDMAIFSGPHAEQRARQLVEQLKTEAPGSPLKDHTVQ